MCHNPSVTGAFEIAASRHPRLSGIGWRNKLNSKKDSGQAGMTELEYLLAGVLIGKDSYFIRKKVSGIFGYEHKTVLHCLNVSSFSSRSTRTHLSVPSFPCISG